MSTADEDTRVEPTRPSARSRREATIQPKAGMPISERVRLVEPLASGGMSEVWVAEHLTLDTRVAVKFVLSLDDERMRGRLIREGRLAARLDHPHAVRIYDQGALEDGTPYLVMELLEGATLKHRIANEGPLSIDEARRLVTQVAEVLNEAHRMNILHRDVKPDNVMLLSSTAELFAKVLDFGVAKDASSEENITLTLDGHMVGTPAYMAPEQLLEGKPANKDSDLWALGVLAYEALAGHRPFRGLTRAAVGVAMMLERHEPVFASRPELPETLAGFFGKALRLQPEERFRTSQELSAAFVEALTGEPAGETARAPSGLRIPQKLYGRDAELAVALDAYESARGGRSRLLLIKGFSGIGKTALVREVHRRVATRGAISVGGKFDQFDRGQPYQSFVQALGVLVRVLLGRDSALDAVADNVRNALRGNGQALIDVVPELEDLIGRQPALPIVSASEAKHRFHGAVRALLCAIATARRPLILFLDDLQWADLPSLELITTLVTDPDTQHVLFIGAYRDNEVAATHPVARAVEQMQKVGAVDELALGPLDEDAVLELLSDTVGPGSGRLRLAMTCHARTRGNAFFLRRFLEALYEDGLLAYEVDSDSWTWDLPQILQRPIEENIVEFVSAELKAMPKTVGYTLSVAACIGDRFDLETLAHVLDQAVGPTLKQLKDALAAELVMPATGNAWLPVTATDTQQEMVFRFAHDRVRQAARGLIDDREAAAVHASVGDYMRTRLSDGQRDERFFEMVEHLVRGLEGEDTRPEMKSAEWRVETRDLCLTAARRSADSAAFAAAHRYYSVAERLVEDDLWSTEYTLALELRVHGARAAYLAGDPEVMRARIEDAVSHGETPLDRARAREVEIHARVADQDLAGAVELGRALLGDLGFELPSAPTEDDVRDAVSSTLALLGEHDDARIARLPMAEDEAIAFALQIQTGITTSAYLAAPRMLPLLGCSIVRATFEHGVCRDSPYGFAILGLVLHAAGLVDLADRAATVALAMLDRLDSPAVGPKTRHVVAGHLRIFTRPIRESAESLRHVFEQGMDRGDLEYASWALHLSVANSFYAGECIEDLRALHDRHVSILEHHRQLPQRACTLPFGQLLENLVTERDDPTRLVGDVYDAEAGFRAMVEADFRGAAIIISTLQVFVRCVFGDFGGAVVAADQGAPFLDGAVATYHQVSWHFYRSFAVLARAEPSTREAAVEDIAESVSQLWLWAGFSPANHAHRIALIEAELARLGGDAAARKHYEAAVAHARDEGFLHDCALAQERLAAWLEAEGDDDAAVARAETKAAYEAWGATAKAARVMT
ncbi:MAG: AAA family ATPase [Sandaracinaceae bacterium]